VRRKNLVEENEKTEPVEPRKKESFADAAARINALVVERIRDDKPLDDVLGNEKDCIYIKAADRRVLYANAACHRILSTDKLVVGQFSDSMIPPHLAHISNLSDDLVMAGCTNIRYDHFSTNQSGADAAPLHVSYHTAKYSLMGLGHRSMAILGITRVLREPRRENSKRIRAMMMTEGWNRFQKLDSTLREIAVQLVQGEELAEIAKRRKVTKRTIENHRARILKELEVANPIELAKLLVRLQENGFGDLGI
jgi:DNA-binding CsgD family transcriptional regulator